MKTNFLILIFSLSFFSMNAKTNQFDYQSLWNKVLQYERESLPQSALEVVNEIYRKASDENDGPERIKSLIYQLKFKTAINWESMPEIIREIEGATANTTDKVEQSLLYSILAELYSNYFRDNNYQIGQRTDLTDYVPEDIREWSKNIFTDKIENLIHFSIRETAVLQTTSIKMYRLVLTEGNYSRDLRPTVYDFLIHRSIDLLTNLQYEKDYSSQIGKLYQDLIDFREKEGNPESLLFAQLDQADYIYWTSSFSSKEKEYLEKLEKLRKTYESYDFCAEILFKEANLKSNRVNAENTDPNTSLKEAYELCLEGIRKYPDYERIGLLKNVLNEITSGEFNVTTDNTVYPGQTLNLSIKSKNLDRINIEIYKINAPASVYNRAWSRQNMYKDHGELVLRKEVELANPFPYLHSDTIISIPMKELGNYEYLIYTDEQEKNTANQQFSVSRLATFSAGLSDERFYVVTDRISGKPVQGASVDFYEQKSIRPDQANAAYGTSGLVANIKTAESTKTDKLGLAFGSSNRSFSGYQVSYEKDTSLILSSVPYISSASSAEKDRLSLSLFTDRSIYRPGQTVYFKGIIYRTGKDTQEVVSNEKATIELYDANGKVIRSEAFTSNEYGSFAGEFTLPRGLLNGYFYLRSETGNAWQNIQVEEYKRPSFEITFKENTQTYSLGDQVNIEGNAQSFSGISVGNAELTYQIVRQDQWPFFRSYNSPVQIDAGTIKTDESGNFTISFIAEKEKGNTMIGSAYYHFSIEASITDSKGETQANSTSVRIGERSMILNFSGFSNNVILKEQLPVLRINATNLSMNPVKNNGELSLYSLKEKSVNGEKEYLNNRSDLENWIQDRLVFTSQFSTEEALLPELFQNLPSGAYQIVARSKDDFGRDIEAKSNFILGSLKDKRPPVPVYLWDLAPKTTCEIGENAEIIIGSSLKNVYVLYQLFQEGKPISASRFVLNNENKKIEIPFKESYGNGISASFLFVKDGKSYWKAINIVKKQTDKKLNLKLEVFRDRLIPGQKEEWKISLKDGENNPVLSELLASMYDASLDRILGHFWSFNPIPSISLRGIRINQGNEFSQSSSWFFDRKGSVNVPGFHFDSFNWFGWHISQQILSMLPEYSNNAMPTVRGISAGVDIADIADHKVVVMEGVTDQELMLTQQEESEAPAQVRQNFDETAFFYPQLKTNEAGETLISFTLPESNTKWKFMALAHTQDLKSGQLLQEVISQKKLMVTPNMPRFIREGDKTSISATISNLSDQTLSGEIYLECLDPVSEKPIITISNQTQAFSLEPGKTSPVSWTFEVPSGMDMSIIKVVAKAESFSDGEQHLIPVLPNKILVTESLPLAVSGKESRTYQLSKLAKTSSATLENYRLSLEFTSNPVWYAVQALPTLSNPESENVVSWFASYYANVMATHIANSTPQLKQTIDIWMKESGNKETLLSGLEKNQELKTVLLEETPWVLEAENETEQKQRLSLLFDINRSSYQSNQALEKLQTLQTESGGWSWFNGMQPSVSITQWILYGMKNLQTANQGQLPDEIQKMTQNAVDFIDFKFLSHFESLKKNNSKWESLKSISTYELEYLWVRSMYSEFKPEKEIAEATDFYLNVLKKNWTGSKSIYDRAISSMVLRGTGEEKTADSILKSLREHASRSKESGMYWANLRASAFAFQSATCIHTFIMRAFDESGATKEEMDAMKHWLLKQKQVQHWESTPATVNAIHALLETGSNWLESRNRTTIQWGKQSIDMQNAETGTGYIKETLTGQSITPDKARVEISKTDDGPAWGALYWQYYENIDKVSASKTGLNVEKALFIEKIEGKNKELIPINAQNPLKVGDKVIVRLTVRSDRDFEYVHLKDMRAAAMEPAEQLSGTRWAQGVAYYQSTKDASMNFYFHNLPKGTYVFEYALHTNRSGNYSNGVCTIQCLYAPEYISHTSGGRISVN